MINALTKAMMPFILLLSTFFLQVSALHIGSFRPSFKHAHKLNERQVDSSITTEWTKGPPLYFYPTTSRSVSTPSYSDDTVYAYATPGPAPSTVSAMELSFALNVASTLEAQIKSQVSEIEALLSVLQALVGSSASTTMPGPVVPTDLPVASPTFYDAGTDTATPTTTYTSTSYHRITRTLIHTVPPSSTAGSFGYVTDTEDGLTAPTTHGFPEPTGIAGTEVPASNIAADPEPVITPTPLPQSSPVVVIVSEIMANVTNPSAAVPDDSRPSSVIANNLTTPRSVVPVVPVETPTTDVEEATPTTPSVAADTALSSAPGVFETTGGDWIWDPTTKQWNWVPNTDGDAEAVSMLSNEPPRP